MKKIIIILVLSFLIITACSNTEATGIIGTYKGEEVYTYDVNEFIKLKTALTQLYYSDLDEPEDLVELNEEISEKEFFDYMQFCQYNFMEKDMRRYLEFTDEEKILDYFVSRERYDYIYYELKGNDFVDEINAYNKEAITWYREAIDNGSEISVFSRNFYSLLEELSKDSGMSFDKYIEEVYLKVEMEAALSTRKISDFLENEYEGEIYEYFDIETFSGVYPMNFSSDELLEYWDITTKYYAFVEEYNNQLYAFLKERAVEDVIFY